MPLPLHIGEYAESNDVRRIGLLVDLDQSTLGLECLQALKRDPGLTAAAVKNGEPESSHLPHEHSLNASYLRRV